MSDTDLLFVYGTLRLGCGGAEARKLNVEAEWLGQARLRGRLYRVDWYPALVMAHGEAGYVIGDMFRMADPAATLAWLDSYEECGPDFPEPQEYRRVIAETERLDGSGTLHAWVYVYACAVENLPWIECGDWFGR